MTPVLRFTIAAVMMVSLLVGGTVGYRMIEGWDWVTSLYMTVITVTTVGFGEVQQLDAAGRYFTMGLLGASILVAGYSVTTLISFLFEGHMVRILKGRRMERALSKLKDHYIVCGGGVVGKEVAAEFKAAGVPFVMIERDPENSELSRDESILFVTGNAEDEVTLEEAGIERAAGLVSVVRQDESNVFVVLTARQMNPKLTIVARAAEERTVSKLLKAGADRVISPYQIAGRRIASVILRPSVVNFLDVIVERGDVTMRLEEVHLSAGSSLIGKRLRESGIGQQTGVVVVGVQSPEGRTRAGAETLGAVTLQEGDVLIALGSDEQLEKLEAFVKA